MKEVSCRVFEIFLQEMKRRSIDPAVICRGTGVEPKTLADKNARIDWSDFRKVMANLGEVFTRDELATIGRAHVGSPLLMPIFVAARLLFNTAEIYQYWTQPNGPGQQLFACMDSRCQVIDDTHLIVEIMVQAGYEPCDEFYITSIGGLASVPTILGLDFAEVEMERTTFGARYHITLPKGDGRLASFRRTLTWPFTVRQAGRALRDANEGLVRQYREIAAAQSALSVHTRQLSVAHRISETMHRALDFERTLETIVGSLEEVAGFARASIECEVPDEQGVRALERSAGEAMSGPPDLTLEFSQDHEPTTATLKLWIPAGAARTEFEELAEFLRPTIMIALDNARSLSALQTSRAQLNQRVKELTHAYGLVEQASIVKSQFVTNMSHELRTPMNGVLGMTTLLRDTTMDRTQTGYLDMLEQSGQNLLRIINDVLDFSTLEAGSTPLESTVFDAPAIVEEVVRQAQAEAAAKGVSIALRVGRGVPTQLRGDAGRVGQLVTNLVNNAVKFTERGGATASVSVAGRREGRVVLRLEVTDTGVGIEPEKMPLLFQPFTQADGSLSRKFGGAGLGLSIAKRLAEMMDAEVRVESQPGKGSRFWCDVPLDEVPGRAEPALLPPQGDLRVMVFDATEFTREVAAEALRDAGMEVRATGDLAALAAQAERGWDAVDVLVLVEDPATAPELARLLADPALPRGKALLVSDPRVAAEARAARVESLPKPLRTDRLVDAVVAARQRALQQAASVVPASDMQRAFVREPEVLTERILVQLLKKRGVIAIAVPSIAELARLSAREPEALIFTSLSTSSPTEQRDLEQLLHRLDLVPGGRRLVAMVSDRGEVPRGHVQRFLTIATRPIRMALIDEVLDLWQQRPGAVRRSEATP